MYSVSECIPLPIISCQSPMIENKYSAWVEDTYKLKKKLFLMSLDTSHYCIRRGKMLAFSFIHIRKL